MFWLSPWRPWVSFWVRKVNSSGQTGSPENPVSGTRDQTLDFKVSLKNMRFIVLRVRFRPSEGTKNTPKQTQHEHRKQKETSPEPGGMGREPWGPKGCFLDPSGSSRACVESPLAAPGVQVKSSIFYKYNDFSLFGHFWKSQKVMFSKPFWVLDFWSEK